MAPSDEWIYCFRCWTTMRFDLKWETKCFAWSENDESNEWISLFERYFILCGERHSITKWQKEGQKEWRKIKEKSIRNNWEKAWQKQMDNWIERVEGDSSRDNLCTLSMHKHRFNALNRCHALAFTYTYSRIWMRHRNVHRRKLSIETFSLSIRCIWRSKRI